MMILALAASAFIVDVLAGLLYGARWRATGFGLWLLSLIAIPVTVLAIPYM